MNVTIQPLMVCAPHALNLAIKEPIVGDSMKIPRIAIPNTYCYIHINPIFGDIYKEIHNEHLISMNFPLISYKVYMPYFGLENIIISQIYNIVK